MSEMRRQQELEFYPEVDREDENQPKALNQEDIEDNIQDQYLMDSNEIQSQNQNNKKQNSCLWITILIGVIFHMFFAYSIFDVYIQSWKPLNLIPIQPFNEVSLAKRIVMLQIDGGRAETFFEYQTHNDEPEIGKPRFPLAHDLILNGIAAFGVSHASVPTESRSCVQTMMGGYLEDMTAILSGWVNGGMHYDNVYNYVQNGWYFGPRMIESIFKNEKCPQCLRKDFFPESEISFSDFESIKQIDYFTINNIMSLFEGKINEDEDIGKNKFDVSNLKKDKIMIYGNLAGTDATGHAFKPNSWQYRSNMRRDGIEIKKIVERVEEYYNHDNQTVFILTADHGMADNGAHGDGSLENTRVPFVIWGPGIKPAENEKNPKDPISHDDYSKPWKLNKKMRQDIDQNQITSLISSILGLPIPINNEGILPLFFLQAPSQYRANALLLNAMQLADSYKSLEEDAITKLKSFFITYKYSSEEINKNLLEIKQNIKDLAEKQKQSPSQIKETEEEFNTIINDIYEKIDHIQSGKQYIMLYQMRPLQVVVGLGYLGFMLFCLISISKYINSNQEDDEIYIAKSEESRNIPTKITTILVSLLSLLYLVITQAPISYYAYFGFPIFFFYIFFTQLKYLQETWDYSFIQMIFFSLSVFIAGASLMYSFFDRNFISYIYIVLAVSSLIYAKIKYSEINIIVIIWSLCCLAISIFPVIPALEKKNDIHYAIGFVMIAVMLFSISFAFLRKELHTSVKILTVTTLYGGFISPYTNYLIDNELPVSDYLLYFNRTFLFVLVFCGFFVNFHYKSNYMLRFYSLMVIIANIFLMFGIGHDVIFVAVFGLLLRSWISYEQYQVSMEINSIKEQSKILPHHFFFAFKLLLFMNTSFFGTGNIISISSLNMDSVNRFILNQRELLIGGLIIFKLCQPFLATSAAFICICKSAFQKINSIGLFFLSLILVEIMTLFFFFMVKTQGTWQEKGGSVARFVISSLLIITYTVLFIISKYFFRKVKV